MPATIDLVRAGATMGDIVETTKRLWGGYRETPAMDGVQAAQSPNLRGARSGDVIDLTVPMAERRQMAGSLAFHVSGGAMGLPKDPAVSP